MKLNMIRPVLNFVEKFDFNLLLYSLSALSDFVESLYRTLILHKCYHSQVKFILLNFKDQPKALCPDISLKGLKKTAKNIFQPNLSVN
jgi:2-iminoacetate synthase ThiH